MASLLSRAVGGAAAGVAGIASKYIDQNIEMMKAQALADLQRSTSMAITKDRDAYENDPTRRQRLRDEGTKDSNAASAAALEAERTRAGDPGLRQAGIDQVVAEEGARGKVQRDNTIAAGGDEVFLKAQRAIAAATRVPESALAIAQADVLKLELQDRKRLGHLYDQVEAVSNDKTLDDAARSVKLKPLLTGIQTIKAKAGSGHRDPELDTETITEETTDPVTGKVTKNTRKEVRRPGGKPAAGEDPIKAAMDAARAANQPKPATPAAPSAPAAGSIDDRQRAQRSGNKPLMDRTNAAAPQYEPPADSKVGKMRARVAADEQATQQQQAQQQQQAAQAFTALDPADKKGAMQLQASPLFDFLTLEQKQEIYRRANAR